MPEEFDEQEVKPFEIDHYLGILRRRHMLLLIVLLLGWVAVWVFGWTLPERFKSSTLILVEQPVMSTSYIVPNVNADLQDRLQTLTEQILSRTRLLAIIDKFGLYSGGDRVITPDEKVAQMRKDIKLDLVRDGQSAITAFRVSYTAPTPELAQNVTNDLTSLLINENLAARQQQTQDTTQFLHRQLELARANLTEQEAKIRAFQSSHQGTLPTEEGTNVQILSGLQSQMRSEQDALNAANQQRIYHQSMFDQYRSWQSVPRTANGAPADLAAVDQQLNTLRAKLADLSTRYTSLYPEVEETKSEIAKAEKTRSDLLVALRNQPTQNDEKQDAQMPGDPSQDAQLLQIRSQLKADQVDISNREQTIATLKSKIAGYQARLSAAPAVAQELADLTRGYEQSQANYNDLLKKENDSRMATGMEQMQAGDRFSVIDPPSLPLKPVFPNRLLISAVGFGAGVILALLAAALMEFLDDRLHSGKDIEELLPVPVISEIPEALNSGDQVRIRRKAMLGWAMAVVVFAIILAGTAFSYLRA